MSWIQKLYETSVGIDKLQLSRAERPWPVSHVAKKAHVEVTIGIDGELRRVRALNFDESVTIIPVTGQEINVRQFSHVLIPQDSATCVSDLKKRWLLSDINH